MPRARRDARSFALALRLCAIVSCPTVTLAAQDTSALAPGNARVDGKRIRPYTYRYAVYQVPTSDAEPGTRTGRVGTLIERVELSPLKGDTVIIQSRQTLLCAGDTSVDTLILDRRTLAPLAQRTTWNARYPHRGHYRRGTNFHGDSLFHFGTIPEESIDKVLARPAFFEGTEALLLRALRDPRSVTTPFMVARLSYDETRPRFLQGDALVHVRDTVRSPVRTRSGNVWVLRFGGTTYWVTKDSLEVLEWEEPQGEGGFLYRFVFEEAPSRSGPGLMIPEAWCP